MGCTILSFANLKLRLCTAAKKMRKFVDRKNYSDNIILQAYKGDVFETAYTVSRRYTADISITTWNFDAKILQQFSVYTDLTAGCNSPQVFPILLLPKRLTVYFPALLYSGNSEQSHRQVIYGADFNTHKQMAYWMPCNNPTVCRRIIDF